MHSGIENLKKNKRKGKIKSVTGVLQPNVSLLEYNLLNYFLFSKYFLFQSVTRTPCLYTVRLFYDK